MLNGVLLLDKSPQMTSFAAVQAVRRRLNAKKAGHTGTLDPMATGVLPIFLGQSTRFIPYLEDNTKVYLADFALGLRTDTLDSTGTVIETHPVSVTQAFIGSQLDQFRGKIQQTPPMFSAKQQGGQRLYALARQGLEVERAPCEVEVFLLELVAPQRLRVHCSAGTYVRSLIDDLGQALGCGAIMTALRRVEAHGFAAEQCMRLETIDTEKILPVDSVLQSYPKVVVSELQTKRFLHGGALARNRLPAMQEIATLWRVYGSGVFLGLGHLGAEELAPARIYCP